MPPTVTDTLVFDAFGNETGRTGTTDNPYGFQGEEQDATGLYYLRARYMDPATGTFTTMDTYGGSLSDPMSLHKYLFANSNPVMYCDPSGHMTVGELMLSTTIMSALSATTNAIIAGLEYEKRQDVAPDIFDKDQWACIGLAFLKGMIVGAMSVMAIFVVYALALTVIQCMMAAGICALLAWMLGEDASFNRRNGNNEVAWIEETLSEGFIAAEVTFAMAGISGGGSNFSKMPYEEWEEYYVKCVKNPDADTVMLGKYDNGGPTSYINQAGSEYTYFDLGKDWDYFKLKYGYTDDDLFGLFNERFLNEQISMGKNIKFSHSPINDLTSLGREYDFIISSGKYSWDESTMMLVYIN